MPQQPYNPYDYTHDQGDTAATHHPQTNRPMPELQQQEGGPYETGDNMANAASVGGQFAEGGYSAMPSAFDPAGGAHNLIPQVGQAVGQGQQLHAVSHPISFFPFLTTRGAGMVNGVVTIKKKARVPIKY